MLNWFKVIFFTLFRNLNSQFKFLNVEMMNAWKTLKTFNWHLIAKTLITLLSQVRVRDDISQKSITLSHSLYVQSQGLLIHWFLFVLFVIFVLTVSCFIIDQTACFCHWIYFSFFHVQPFIGDYLIWVQFILSLVENCLYNLTTSLFSYNSCSEACSSWPITCSYSSSLLCEVNPFKTYSKTWWRLY